MEKRKGVLGVICFIVVCFCLVGKIGAMNTVFSRNTYSVVCDTSPQRRSNSTYEKFVFAIKSDDVKALNNIIVKDSTILKIKIKGENGKTVFHLAAEYGSENICAFLLGKNISPFRHDRYNMTPLMYAACMNYIDIITLILWYIRDKYKNYYDMKKQYSIKELFYNYVDHQDEYGNTALHHAVLTNSFEAVAILLKMGANFYLKNKSELSPAGIIDSFIKNEKFYSKIGKTYSDQLCKAMLYCCHFKSPYLLHHAAREGDVELMKKFIALRFSVNEQDRFGYVALHYAVRAEDGECIRFLLSCKGVDLTMRSNIEGLTPYEYACKFKSGNKNIIECFSKGYRASCKQDEITPSFNDKDLQLNTNELLGTLETGVIPDSDLYNFSMDPTDPFSPVEPKKTW